MTGIHEKTILSLLTWSAKGVGVLPKIFVVDDDEDIRFLYSEELNEAGYEVITAGSHCKLREKIHAEKPDLAVVDIKMTDCNGLDIFQDIRNHFCDLPVILSTAYHMNKEDMQSIDVDFYVVKSFDLTELKEKIAMALE